MITTLANLAVLAAGAPERARLLGIRDLAASQEALLRRILRRDADSEYGRRHGFAQIRNHADYRERVPIVTWDDLAGDVERIAMGEQQVLGGERVRLLEPSSGSTAATKLVPSTRGSQREFQRAIGAWLADLAVADPRLLTGRSYWSVTPAAAASSHQAAGPVPIGFEDDAAYAGALRAHLLRRVFAVESGVARSTTMADFYRRTARGLLAADDLCLVSVWNPSYLSLLLEQVAELAPSLADELPASRRPAARAAARGDWEAVWPRLRLVSCWADAHAARPAGQLQSLLPQARLQPKGLLATEGVVSIPVETADGAVLAARSHLVEFKQGDRVVLGHELRQGERYEVLLTTSAGLHRYRLGDEVEVTGWHGSLPVLRLVGRCDAVSDLVGEKLSEAFVAVCLRELDVDCFAVLAPEQDHYALYLGEPRPGLEAGLERLLRRNFHYDHARRLGQLGPVRAVVAGANADRRLLEARRRAGQRLGDVKTPALARGSLAFLVE
ncbi:GH3 family domain-containing protein [Luteococcus sp. OSA5]|uniref:GH3 family domain-containing protein n=1 Tax=Luteococcus sp. OSA5 TaxID=3401630 RepID=UPI003B43221D